MFRLTIDRSRCVLRIATGHRSVDDTATSSLIIFLTKRLLWYFRMIYDIFAALIAARSGIAARRTRRRRRRCRRIEAIDIFETFRFIYFVAYYNVCFHSAGNALPFDVAAHPCAFDSLLAWLLFQFLLHFRFIRIVYPRSGAIRRRETHARASLFVLFFLSCLNCIFLSFLRSCLPFRFVRSLL
jgi:hypothetical protein